jgi:ABC-type antimicrobial peptide transport system permease subunit
MANWRVLMSSGTGFPVNDLMRRRLQTGLTITMLTLSVASTLFLLLFSSRLGLGLSSATNTFTIGLSSVFSQFIVFIGVLVFIVGGVLVSFIVFLMMAQRTRDFGLIKTAGCPSSLVGGYFMTELFMVTFVGCVLGIIFGFIADFVVANIVFGGYQVGNWWFAPTIFIVFFALAVFFGLKPILKAAKMSAVEALSPVNYYSLTITGKHKALIHSALTWRMASRSMVRHLSPIVRIVILLSTVFTLLSVSVAGGIIAKDTTTAWVEKTTESGTIAIAYGSMGSQYELLLSKFTGVKDSGNFNYSNSNLVIPTDIKAKLTSLSSVSSVDTRLVLYENVKEICNFTEIDGANVTIGGHREGSSVVIGLDPQKMADDFSTKGRSLSANATLEAVIGDSISQTMYYPDKIQKIAMSDPLLESIKIEKATFRIVGVCIDPLNNGYVTYVPIDKLMNDRGITSPNLLLVTLNPSADRGNAIDEIRNMVKAVDSNLEVFDLSQTVVDNSAFLGATWQTIMFIPMFSLVSASLCLVGYMMLSVDEQRQEFGMLRAIGAKPKIIITISAIQSAIVLASSFGVGISFGIITTLLILMANPLVTSTTIFAISAWLVSALIAMFLLSLYPAFKLSKTSILKIMA